MFEINRLFGRETIFIVVEKKLPSDYIDLFWKIFFLDKARGVSVKSHFPWIYDSNVKYWCVLLKKKDTVVGGLVVKEALFSDVNLLVGVAGLVCISPELRGKGYAKNLLDIALEEAKKRKYDAMTLWTGKPSVYHSSGFELHDNLMFGSVRMDSHLKVNKEDGISVKPISDSLPLPVFAMSGNIFSYKGSEIIVVQGTASKLNHTIVRYSGVPSEITLIIRSVLPEYFFLNVKSKDLLVKILEQKAELSLKPVNLQMWKVLNSQYSIEDIMKLTEFDVLDRI